MNSRFLRLLGVLVVLLTLLPARLLAQAAYDPAAKAATIAPFLDEQTLAVARLDLTKLDPAAAMKLLGEVAPEKGPQTIQQLAAIEQQAKAILQSLSQAGCNELYAVVSLADFPKEPAFVVAPVAGGQDPQKAAATLRGLMRFEVAEVRGATVV